LRTAGETVFEAPKRTATVRRRGGKSDSLDAVHAARAVLAADHIATPRADGDREARLQAASPAAQAGARRRQTVPVRATGPRPVNTVRPRDVVGKTRRWLASEIIHELVTIDKKIKIANAELTDLVASTGSRLQDLHGIGPSGAARLLGDVDDIHRFASRAHFASWNGTAPIDASSGDQNRHRLSRAGKRRINRTLHIMAIVQLRHDTEGRRYYRRKLAAGKTPMEALRALKRRLSDDEWMWEDRRISSQFRRDRRDRGVRPISSIAGPLQTPNFLEARLRQPPGKFVSGPTIGRHDFVIEGGNIVTVEEADHQRSGRGHYSPELSEHAVEIPRRQMDQRIPGQDANDGVVRDVEIVHRSKLELAARVGSLGVGDELGNHVDSRGVNA
jgi:hypothetical protein